MLLGVYLEKDKSNVQQNTPFFTDSFYFVLLNRMNYPEQITLEGEELAFWKQHSGLISDLADQDDYVIMERSFFDIIGPGSELVDENVYPEESSDLYWQLFVDLVEGNKVATFNKSGRALLDLRKGYTKKRLVRLLDYLDFPTTRVSLDELKNYMSKKRINVSLPTIPRGVGIRKTGKLPYTGNRFSRKYMKYYRNRFVNENNNNNNKNNNNNSNNNSIEELENLYEYKNNNNSISHLLPAGKYVPYAKQKKQREKVKRRHTFLTKKKKQRNQKPAKTRRLEKSKNRKTNYWNNSNNLNNEEVNSLND